MRHSLNFSTLILVLRGIIIFLDSLNYFVMKKNYIFTTSTHILESVYVPGDTISGMSKVNTRDIK